MSLLNAFNLYMSWFPIRTVYNNIYKFMLRKHMLRLPFFLVVCELFLWALYMLQLALRAKVVIT